MQNFDYSMNPFTLWTVRKWLHEISNVPLKIHFYMWPFTYWLFMLKCEGTHMHPYTLFFCTLHLFNLCVLLSIRYTAVGFTGCSAVRQPSWLSEFSEFNVAGGWLAGWIRWQCQISDINHQPPLLLLPPPPLSAVSPFYSPLLLFLLLSPISAIEAVNTTCPFYCNSPFLSIHPHTCLCLPLLLFLSPLFLKLTYTYRAVADSAGFVMNGILLHIRRKCTLHCGFTNCLHCPQNDSLYTAENGSQPARQSDRRTDSTAQTDRRVCRAYRQTAQERQAERRIACDRYSQHRTEADNLPIQKRPATSGYRQQMKDRWVIYTDRQQRVCHICFQLEYDIFLLQSDWVENWDNKPWN